VPETHPSELSPVGAWTIDHGAIEDGGEVAVCRTEHEEARPPVFDPSLDVAFSEVGLSVGDKLVTSLLRLIRGQVDQILTEFERYFD
jgi:hypothetical protein